MYIKDAPVILSAEAITKQFPGVLANDKVNFDLRKGEVHTLLGENGAGKSTLMNVLYGLYKPDSGHIHIDGKPVTFTSPKDAIANGIGMVHQHFMLIPVFTVAENIMLGSETTRNGVLDIRAVSKQVRELSHTYGLDVDPDALVQDLPVGIQQRVEIVKALYRKANILILDEPTAVLTPQEADDLFQIIRRLTEQGVSIVFISHKLKEVLAISDRVTVMRTGKVVGTTTPQEVNEAKLAAMMVGREVILKVDKKPAKPGEPVLSVSDFSVMDSRGVEVVKKISFEVRSGEVLGIAGIQGNGQTELAEALTGLRKVHGGRVILNDKESTGRPPRQLIENGLGHVPEDRQRHGLVLPFAIADNMMLCTYYQEPFAQKGVLQNQAIDANSRKLIEQFDVRTPSPYVSAGKLSGGNQQKVIVARELSRPIRLLVANQPTRGLDVGSIEYIHHEIIDMRDKGIGVLLISAELDEIMALSDRIAVMFRGEIVATLPAAEANREQLGLLMAGATHK
ncbi:MAG TPA: ABC transporter ATP-binding protein [Anaerolineaceae bacterium]|nr:ABC transporter ATP-binding protein [Anaerolineaceae bacterium]HPN50117.1 ABC transporter ATP-binding protein [Anaerolineaceae bacterium]